MTGWKVWRGPEAKLRMRTGARQAVERTAKAVFAASQSEVPLRDGFLMRSGGVFMAPGDEPAASISYGGGPGTGKPIVPYARRWHEEDANFQRGRKRRYVADPLNRIAPTGLINELRRSGREHLR